MPLCALSQMSPDKERAVFILMNPDGNFPNSTHWLDWRVLMASPRVHSSFLHEFIYILHNPRCKKLRLKHMSCEKNLSELHVLRSTWSGRESTSKCKSLNGCNNSNVFTRTQISAVSPQQLTHSWSLTAACCSCSSATGADEPVSFLHLWSHQTKQSRRDAVYLFSMNV